MLYQLLQHLSFNQVYSSDYLFPAYHALHLVFNRVVIALRCSLPINPYANNPFKWLPHFTRVVEMFSTLLLNSSLSLYYRNAHPEAAYIGSISCPNQFNKSQHMTMVGRESFIIVGCTHHNPLFSTP